jgi:hypothetical protein
VEIVQDHGLSCPESKEKKIEIKIIFKRNSEKKMNRYIKNDLLPDNIVMSRDEVKALVVNLAKIH